jgi:transposase
MLKIILLGYAHGLVTSRRIAKACETNIHFMSVSGDVQPRHPTIIRPCKLSRPSSQN